MLLNNIAAGRNIPDDFNVIIEIPANSSSIKYEFDKDNGILMVDRFMPTSMYYPCNYGFIPSTLADDGDPADVLVVTPFPVQPGSLIRCRAVGMLNMTDEAGQDSKILALPIAKVCSQFAHMSKLEDVPPMLLETIAHFFEYYKALEPGKWVKVTGWEGREEATKEIQASIDRYK
jgi:inorganic pyrophosphatase